MEGEMISYPIYHYNPERLVPQLKLKPPLRLSPGYPFEGVESTPKISSQILYCRMQDGTLQSLDARTLESRWIYKPSRRFESAGLFDGEPLLEGEQVITRFGPQLIILDSMTGAIIKELEILPYDLRSAFVRKQTLIGLYYEGERWGYIGFDLNRFETSWIYKGKSLHEFNASSDDDLFFGDRKGGLFCLDLNSGGIRWLVAISEILNNKAGSRENAAGEVHGVPVIVGELLIVAVKERWIAALARETGELVWARKLRCEDSMGMRCDGWGRVHLVDEFYTQLDARSGKIRCEIDVGDAHRRQGVYINTFVTPSEEWLFFADVHSGILVAMNAGSGEIEWRFECNAGLPLEQPPVIVDGCCYMTDVGGKLYRFEGSV